MRHLLFIITLFCSYGVLNANNYLKEVPLDNYTKEQPTNPDPNNDRDINLSLIAIIDFNQIKLTSNLSISDIYFWVVDSNDCIVYSYYSSQQLFSHVFNNIDLTEGEEYTIFVLIGDSCYTGNFSL